MATVDDMASEREAQFLECALYAQAEAARVTGVVALGECLACGETDLPHPESRYCCDECRKDHERTLKMARIAGRA